MKIGILTTFADFDRSYSLCGVVLEQAGMLMREGVDFTLFVNERGPRLNESSIDAHGWLADHIDKSVPTDKLEEDVVNEEHRQRVAAWLIERCSQFDVLITHDWMFTTWNVTYNAAVRDAVEKMPGTTWVHWVHSAPGGRPARLVGAQQLRYETCPNSLYVYLNHSARLQYAESLGTDISRVMVCHNPLDAAGFLGADEVTAGFIRKHRLWDRDLMQVYPLSMPRADAKGLHKVLGIFGEWKRLGFHVKLVVVNAHTTAPAERKSVEAYKQHALQDLGLGPTDVIFTSDEEGWWADGKEGCAYSVPHEAVRTLFRLSNVFLFPTQSEACSRILQEASLAGCLVVGNESFPPMGEFLDHRTPQHTFGSLTYSVNHPHGENQWLREVAKSLTPLFEHPLMRQQSHMLKLSAWDTIWREQLLPILERAKALAQEREALA
jgi:hypothetical protein